MENIVLFEEFLASGAMTVEIGDYVVSRFPVDGLEYVIYALKTSWGPASIDEAGFICSDGRFCQIADMPFLPCLGAYPNERSIIIGYKELSQEVAKAIADGLSAKVSEKDLREHERAYDVARRRFSKCHLPALPDCKWEWIRDYAISPHEAVRKAVDELSDNLSAFYAYRFIGYLAQQKAYAKIQQNPDNECLASRRLNHAIEAAVKAGASYVSIKTKDGEMHRVNARERASVNGMSFGVNSPSVPLEDIMAVSYKRRDYLASV